MKLAILSTGSIPATVGPHAGSSPQLVHALTPEDLRADFEHNLAKANDSLAIWQYCSPWSMLTRVVPKTASNAEVLQTWMEEQRRALQLYHALNGRMVLLNVERYDADGVIQVIRGEADYAPEMSRPQQPSPQEQALEQMLRLAVPDCIRVYGDLEALGWSPSSGASHRNRREAAITALDSVVDFFLTGAAPEGPAQPAPAAVENGAQGVYAAEQPGETVQEVADPPPDTTPTTAGDEALALERLRAQQALQEHMQRSLLDQFRADLQEALAQQKRLTLECQALRALCQQLHSVAGEARSTARKDTQKKYQAQIDTLRDECNRLKADKQQLEATLRASEDVMHRARMLLALTAQQAEAIVPESL